MPTRRMTAFAYASREQCVCGMSLNDAQQSDVWTYAWGEVQFRRCPACMSWCQSPQITPSSIAAWYDSDLYQGSAQHLGEFYSNYLSDETNRLRESRARVRRDFEQLLSSRGAEVLEVGCASGSLLVVLREAGHNVRGIDLSERFVVAARTMHGLDVQQRDAASVTYPVASFDLVLLLGTISNLPELPKQLQRIHDWLKPGGHLVANFPAADSWTAKLYGRCYWMFAPTANTFYSTTGCRRAMENAGFIVTRLRRDVQQPSLQKIVTHSRLPFAARLLQRLGLEKAILPWPLPVPGIRIVWAQKPVQ
jgi:SAM-dependent methyltransferase